MTKSTFREDPATWWLDHVMYFWFELASRYRSFGLRLWAMTFGTLWVLAAMWIGMPLLVFTIGRDTWRSMSKPS